jgi:glycosyltransferase involved in cell wall biosynthesis
MNVASSQTFKTALSLSENALVSVIIPTYNRPHYLQEALYSALRQTYQNIEIIVSDNCSLENPQPIVEAFQDSRIRFFRNGSNLGMFANTINAFKRAEGKYVASLLDDDVWEPNFLATMVPPLEENSELALSFCDHYIIDAQGKIDLAKTETCSQAYRRSSLKAGTHQPFCRLALIDRAVSAATAAVIRRDAIDWEKIPAEVGGSWDRYLSYLCCTSGRGAYYVPERLTRYRIHDQTDTQQSGRRNAEAKIRKAQAELFCCEQFIHNEKLQEFRPYFEEQWAHHNTTLAIGLLRTAKPKEARFYLWRSLNRCFSLRTLAALLLSFAPPQFASRF